MLTRALVESGARVVAVERDPSHAAALRARFGEGVSVVEADVLDWHVPTEPFVVVANLPFAGSGAILRRLLGGPVTRADVIVEWGFAQKQAAIWPVTLKSAFWGAFYALGIVRHLDRSGFTPPQASTGPSCVSPGARLRSCRLVRRSGTGGFCLEPSTQGRKSDAPCSHRFRRSGWRRPSAFDRARAHATSTRASGQASTQCPGARRPGYDGE
jgi:hypothetical protein